MNMKQTRLFLFITLIAVCLLSCKKSPWSNGEVKTVARSIASFSKIEMYDNVDVTLVKSEEPRVDVRSGSNLIDNIVTDVDGDRLTIKNENTCNWLRSYDVPIEVTVYFDKIDTIYYESVGNLIFHDTVKNDLKVNVHDGSGDISIKVDCNLLDVYYYNRISDMTICGTADNLILENLAYAPVHAENLQTKFCKVVSHSTNDCFVHCTDSLDATIQYIGDIYYKGVSEEKIHLTVAPGATGRLRGL